MSQAGSRPRLLNETLFELAVVGKVAMHDLDRHAAFKAEVGREVDGCHTPARYAGPDLVSTVEKTTNHRVGAVDGHHASLKFEPERRGP